MNQRGFTLVELLGGLVLVFIIGTGIFTTLTHSLNLFQREAQTIDVRAQANIIKDQLTTFYQEHEGFMITPIGKGGIKISSPISEESRVSEELREFYLPGHQIEISYDEEISNSQFTSMKITIEISEETKGAESFKLTTTVSRLREG